MMPNLASTIPMFTMAMSKKNYQWDAAQYAQYSSSQFAWALELIDKLKLQGDETVLDIGCGDGKVTAAIADRLPRGRVIGIDSSLDMIALARRRHTDYSNSRLSFQHMDVRELSHKNRFDVIFSNAVLHWVKRHVPVLRRIQQAMNKGGRLLLQMGGQGNAAQVVSILDSMIKGKWTCYFIIFEFPYGFYGPEEYSGWLMDVGLDPLRIELIEKDMQHKARDGFAGWIRSTWLPYLERIPTNRQQEFIDSLLDEYLNLHPMDNKGIVHVTMMRLEVEAVKP
jgi:trans-aconitate methyltransferase